MAYVSHSRRLSQSCVLQCCKGASTTSACCPVGVRKTPTRASSWLSGSLAQGTLACKRPSSIWSGVVTRFAFTGGCLTIMLHAWLGMTSAVHLHADKMICVGWLVAVEHLGQILLSSDQALNAPVRRRGGTR